MTDNEKTADRFKIDPDNYRHVMDILERDSNGVILKTTENFLRILKHDQCLKDVFFNAFAERPCYVVDDRWVTWQDSDDAHLRAYIERVYHLRDKSRLEDAFAVFLTERCKNPLTDLIGSYTWDGQKRCETFLIRWMKAEDNPYNRECSRLIFADAIKRAFEPGSKVENVIVLKGDQGSGKSTLCQWLALRPEYYFSIQTFEGKDALQNMRGKWIAELEELMAIAVNSRSSTPIEKVKAFISVERDTYRDSYGRRSIDHPRSCVFIGTTNRDRFLTDPTGNRRWFPVQVHSEATMLYQHEEEVKHDIEQAYAEMLDAYKKHSPFAAVTVQAHLRDDVRAMQAESEQDDPRVGMIEEQIKTVAKSQDYVCCAQMWDLLYNPDGKQSSRMTRTAANEIGELLRCKLGCEKAGTKRFGPYGPQNAFRIPDKYL